MKTLTMKKSILSIIIFFLLGSSALSNASLFDTEKPLSLYPNPAANYLNILLTSDDSAIPEIRFVDLTGKIVKKVDQNVLKESSVYRAEIDISDLKTGIYFVKVIQGKKTFTEKLVVK